MNKQEALPEVPLSSLRVTFGFVLAAMVAVTAATITMLSAANARQTTLEVSEALVGQLADVTRERVERFLEAPRRVNKELVADLHSGALDPENSRQLDAVLFDVLEVYPSLRAADLGRPDGSFTMLKRMPDDSLHTKRIAFDEDGQRSTTWTRRAPGIEFDDVIAVEDDPTDTYDPRKRPWYTGADSTDQLFWTDVYVFFSDRQAGLTASLPWRSKEGELEGVVSVDISLRKLSAFLSDLEVGKTGAVYLIDEDERVVASPHPDDLVREVETDKGTVLELRRVAESVSPALQALGQHPDFDLVVTDPNTEHTTLHWSAEGAPYIGAVRSIVISPTKSWRIVVLAPEDDFLADVKAHNRTSILVAVGFALLSLLVAVLLARWLASSLRVLVVESERIQQLDLDTPITHVARFKEVHDVLVAFQGMKVGLRSMHKYLPTELVTILLESGREPELGSQLQEVTLYFSDIAGFTTVSEKLGPEKMAVTLGHYLSALSDVIGRHEGTVVQYVGDEIMGMWNAPLDVPNHPERACAAVLECVEQVNEIWTGGEGGIDFPTRFGLHTAEVAVGHFGSPNRLYYGAVGDGVNLCSRLEGANKVYGTHVLISESVASRVRDSFVVRHIDRIVVKGRRGALDVYELVGVQGEVEADRLALIAAYEAAVATYLSGGFTDALAAFDGVLERWPEDLPAQSMRERLATLVASPPPDWDGAWHLMHK